MYLKIFALLFSIIIMSSCNKREDFQDSPSIRNVLESKNHDERKQRYLALTAQEQFVIWYQRFDKLIKSNQYNHEQTKFLKSLLTTLDPSIFKSEESKIKNEFIENEPQIRNEGIRLFGFNQAVEIMANLELSPELLASVREGGETELVAANACGCNTSSDYCFKGYVSWQTQMLITDCQGDGCTGTKKGCGLFWQFACNGNCYTVK